MRALPLPLLLAPLLLAACTTTPRDGSPRVQTSAEANRESVQGAVSAPLRDLNMLRTKIPPVLLQAMADPYARPPRNARCAQLIALVRPLDDALGADLDKPPTDEDLLERGRESALGAVADVTADVIPFRGWVRKLSGAERHDRFVQAAITAGAVRRAYLKGLGESRGCDPPATPSHERAGTPVVEQGFRPRYPTKRPAAAPRTPPGKPPAARPR